MKVECIDDTKQGPGGFGDMINFGDIYEVVGTYTDRMTAETMFVLAGMDRGCPIFGKGWWDKRFRELKRPKQKSKQKQRENA